MKDDPLKEKSLAFAVRIVSLLAPHQTSSLSADCKELLRLLVSSCKTLEKGMETP